MFKEFFALAKPYWKSEERWFARGILAAMLLLSLGNVYALVLLNRWNQKFFDAIQKLDEKAFLEQLVFFFAIALSYGLFRACRDYLSQWLQIRWRRWYTANLLDHWLSGQTYYLWQVSGSKTDNPEQRISEDVNAFVQETLELGTSLFQEILTFFSFVGILWLLSSSVSHLPGYLVWVCFLYAVAGTLLIHWISRALISLSYKQQHVEADFRYDLVRLRENSESVALLSGEEAEKFSLSDRFQAIFKNFRQIMAKKIQYNISKEFYNQLAYVFPFIVAAKEVFSRQISFGTLMQISSAFGQLQGSVSFFIKSYPQIAHWRSVVERLHDFKVSLRKTEEIQPSIAIRLKSTAPSTELRVEKLSIFLPNQQPLLRNIDFRLARGRSLMITGSSGIGKSSLIRTLHGIWPYFEGKIFAPYEEKTIVIPQKTYISLGTLRAALTYPENSAAFTAMAIYAALEMAHLSHLKNQLDVDSVWSASLSLGEQQRVAFARVFLHQPKWLFLDEATASLDEKMQKEMYERIKNISGLSLLSVAHQPSLHQFHDEHLDLGTFSAL